ncbi:MAG: hypothetical protein JNM85_01455 [Chthonomonas sp.]|nr:hypothetical protein [Chthonomonas sp.]
MKIFRLVLGTLAAVLLVGGYAGSQVAVWTGTQAEWTRRMDSAPMPLLSALLVLGAMVAAFIKPEEPA